MRRQRLGLVLASVLALGGCGSNDNGVSGHVVGGPCPAVVVDPAERPDPVAAESPSGFIVDDDMVTDPWTGRAWERVIDPTSYAPADHGDPTAKIEAATAYCDALELGGFDDWRLPDRLELYSIVDHTRASPAIDTEVFPDTPAAMFWTSERQLFPNQYYAVGFDDGGIAYDGDIGYDSIYARCVRTVDAVAEPTTPYQIHGNVALDARTGLLWQRDAPATLHVEPSDAAAACGALKLGGCNSGWRLPTAKEIATLVDGERAGPAMDPEVFPNTEGWYWTATPYERMGGMFTFALSAGDGVIYPNVQREGARARCVTSL